VRTSLVLHLVPDFDVLAIERISVQSLEGVIGVFFSVEADDAVAVLLHGDKVDVTAGAEEVLELAPRGSFLEVADDEIEALSIGSVRNVAGASSAIPPLAVASANAGDVDGDDLVGVLRIDGRVVLHGAPVGEGLEGVAAVVILLDVGVMDEQVLPDLRRLSLGSDESDSPVVEPFRHRSYLPRHDDPDPISRLSPLTYGDCPAPNSDVASLHSENYEQN